MTARIEAEWLSDPDLQRVLAILSADGEEARVVGGAVRNHLLGLAISDIDIATTALPNVVMERAAAAGVKAVPTGVEHGTVTLVVGKRPFEVTTLRRDVATDGRHARVSFGRDWGADAQRRDFTMNALYCGADGAVLDLVGGLADIETRTLRFIGDARTRIEEDHLRSLRFYRFFAWYGAGRPDAEGLRATAALKGALSRLSAERVWSELKRLLGAPDPSRALLWMRQAGVLSAVLPESERWGIDAIHGLMATERQEGWTPDAMLRLIAIVPPDAARMGELAGRLKLSRTERDRLTAWAMSAAVTHDTSDATLRAALYHGDAPAVRDRARLALAAARARPDGDLAATARLGQIARTAEAFRKPRFPLSGADLGAAGIAPGPRMGEAMKALEREWVDSGFTLGRDTLLARIAPKES